jgi:2-keto-4-pentenoate hydratase/2-oxohepta-3-ene-1,7-dioic acid hydratase in catechol pathway
MGRRLPDTVLELAEYLMDEGFRGAIEDAVLRASQGLRLSDVQLRAPVDGRPKIICVGLNYRDHAEEQGVKPPEEPVIFMKPYTAITGPGQTIIYPEITEKLDYEAELAVLIGRRCRKVRQSDALSYVLGYTCFNDVSARDIQFRDGQWVRGKSFDTFAPIGPWIVTADEVRDPHNLRIMARINGEVRQNSNTRNLIFGVDKLVSFISMVMTLEPGDIIATGTPSGVGIFYKPEPKLLKVGDIVEIEIEKIGVLANTVSREL